MTEYYPPWGFYYRVEFEGSREPNEASFQTASGLSVEYDTEDAPEAEPAQTSLVPSGASASAISAGSAARC